MKYQCDKCGNCCRQAWAFAQYYGKEMFPYDVKADGSCEMLDDNNLCKVYDKRPLICNINKLAKALKVNQKEFYRQNREFCLIFRTKARKGESTKGT